MVSGVEPTGGAPSVVRSVGGLSFRAARTKTIQDVEFQ